jgi:simple sugar transport system ATP-binding protein
LSVKTGEILAIAGVAGNGQGELFGVISGEEGEHRYLWRYG